MNIIVYTKTGCPWCNQVIEFLNEKAVEYEEREVSNNKEFLAELVERSGQDKTPTLDIAGYVLADTDKDGVERYLREKQILI
ncbi:MAG: glutaredoxin [Candidatus Taylorbacteria bacterium]|nr:glutaredoxin [Candidatus Taylorbacteria bacterium]